MAAIQPAASPLGLRSARRNFRRILHPDMTPMVGLGFLLVTFFLLAADFTKTTVLQLLMPVKPTEQSLGPACSLSDVITVIPAKNGKVHYYPGLFTSDVKPDWHTTDLTSSGLRQVLLEQKRQSHRLFILIKPTDEAKYQVLVDVLDEMSITGQERYALVDLSPNEKRYLRQNNL